MAVQLEANPAHGGAQKSGAGVVYVKGVDAAEVHGDGGRRIHDKLTGRRPDNGVNGSALERKPFAAWPICDQPEARAGVHFHTARLIKRNAGA